ncbi:MAG TPA: FAD-binding oxidoreductase [Polyangiaceae bacterium]|nr:FAD-binding oxidoreductase [Polyangiaceae bacterium]
MTTRTRSFWHWGFEEDFPDAAAREAVARQAAFMIPSLGTPRAEPLPEIANVKVRASRLEIPSALAHCATRDDRERILHASGKGYRDVLRAFRGDLPYAPDVVVFPERDEDLAATFEWCSRVGAALVPFGGGTSVVSGVTYDGDRPIASVDLARLRRLVDVDETSRLVRAQAGATGPDLEAQLAERGLSLRFYPQSFEVSTLGGWIATRAGGHFATGYTHIDDMVSSVRMMSPGGAFETKTFPASGAGPDPNRLVLGSEGALGVVTEATLRAFHRPTYRAQCTVFFRDVRHAVDAARGVAQAGLFPSNCRVLDKNEALLSGVSMDRCALLLAFESADHELDAWLERAVKIAVRAGGEPEPLRYKRAGKKQRGTAGGAETYRAAFLRGPYMQSALIPYGVMVDTFETACTWSRFDALDREVRAALRAITNDVMIAMRFSHVYPDGPAPYYTFGVPAERGRELEQHERLKSAVSDALGRVGATITHHHAVGRLHRPWYERERPAVFGEVLRAAKRVLDPSSIMNPGVLIEERGA